MATRFDARLERLTRMRNAADDLPFEGVQTFTGGAEHEAWKRSPAGRRAQAASTTPRTSSERLFFTGLVLVLCDRETMERQQRQTEAARARQPKPPPFQQERRRQAGQGVDAESAPHTINDPARAARQETAGDERRSALDFNFWDV